ncbi:ATP-binding protein [Peribacillus deserti]|uniref:ATP-binding protein n=1 Tax=Peribacillus deserti TaxID=673318 RepID=UPI0035B50DA4
MKGTGLGTSVSLRIVEKINGKIAYTSVPGKGTRVEVAFTKKEIHLRRKSGLGVNKQ